MSRALCLLLTAALSTSAWAGEFEYEVSPAEPGKPRVVTAIREARAAALLIRFEAGAAADGATPGLTRLVQQMMLRDSRRVKYAALTEELHAAEATLTVETGLLGSHFLLVAPKDEFLPLAQTLLELTLAPQLNVAQLRKTKSLVARDNGELPGPAQLLRDLEKPLTQDPRFQNDPWGDRSTLEKVSAKLLKQHLAGPLSPANATVVAVGDFDRTRFAELAARFKGGRQTPIDAPALAIPATARGLAAQPVHLLGYRVEAPTPRDRAAMRVVCAALENVVSADLRERGAGYSAFAQVVHRPWLDAMVLALPAWGQPALKLAPVLSRWLATLREGKLDQAVFERNRQHAISELRALDHDPEALAAAVAAFGGSLEWLDQSAVQALEALTWAEFDAAARRWLVDGARFEIEFTAPGAVAASAEGSAR